MQHLNSMVVRSVSGGMTVSKYDETTQALFESIRKNLRSNLERLDKLEPLVKDGYAGFNKANAFSDEL
jgi:hypothetical protein